MVQLTSDKIRQIVRKIGVSPLKVPIEVEGIPDSFKAFFAASLSKEINRSLLIITPTSEEGEKLISDIQFFFSFFEMEKPIFYFPSLEIVPYEQVDPPPAILSERTRTLRHLVQLRADESTLVVASSQSLMSQIPSTDTFQKSSLVLHLFESFPKESLLDKLIELGFEPANMVETPGEFSHRGGIVDFWPIEKDLPVRLELEGDLIESLRSFNPFDQKSVLPHEEVELWPILNKKKGALRKENHSLFSYFKVAPLLILDEPLKVEKELMEFEGEIFEYYAQALDHRLQVKTPQQLYHGAKELLREAENCPAIHWSALQFESSRTGKEKISFAIQSPAQIGLGVPGLTFQKITELLDALRKKETVFLVCHTESRLVRLMNISMEHLLPVSRYSRSEVPSPSPSPLYLTLGTLSSGFYDKELATLFLTEEDLFGKVPRSRTPARRKSKSFISSFEDLKISDLVVHANHGIGQYLGLKHLTIDGITSDFLMIEYKGHDKIFVPLDSLEVISKYNGVEGTLPVLDKLGGSGWSARKQKVRKTLETMTREILDLYASREIARGFAFSPENEMSQEFAASFEFEETPDQLRAIEDVLRDMEEDKPMDRLICGDVGYGKTEVAMRASFKAVKDNKQVLILVPTTLLAQQHFNNFSSRFAPFPVKVEMLSRFRSTQEQKQIVKGVFEGTIDILIGTHRVLQKDLHFHDLGLLIVDEEQRFGVLHKEKIKQLKKSIDVLTLSATPIPRTLQMSLMNLRNMSVIETPPADRLAIRTILTHLDRRILREAIKREIDRNGQVFFVHNRVVGIEKIGNFITSLVPEAAIGIAHGQMNEHQLEEVMKRFIRGEYQILLSTTIIESGLDIPRANTIIINRADHFGLSELYQLRGRVGRSGQQAYAFLLVENQSALSDQAQKRLRALQEFTELGAGFKIAARDLEIRGAGHFLGTQQSGEIASIGFELYIKMLENCVAELRGKKVEEEFNPSLQLGVSAYIPEEYIPDSYQRLYFYKRLSSTDKEEEIEKIQDELRDRFGPVPEEVRLLFKLVGIRILAKQLRIERIDRNSKGIYFTLHSSHEISIEVIKKLTRNPKIRLIPEFSFQLLLKEEEIHQILSEVTQCLHSLL